MLKGLTRAGIGNVGSDANFIRLAAQYGFEAVDLDGEGLLDPAQAAEVTQALAATGVQPGSIGLTVEWRHAEEQFVEGLRKLPDIARAASQLGVRACCTYILPSTDYKAAAFMNTATLRLRQCATILGKHGIKLGLEFVGPHHLRTTWKHPFIWTLEETLDWMAVIGTEHTGLLLDIFHTHTTGITAQQLAQLSPEQIAYVHINDGPDAPADEWVDNQRLYPGEGTADLPGFLGALKQIGYTGVIAQEILSDQPTDATPEQLLQRSKNAFDKLAAYF